MTDPLEARLDALFQLPPAELVSARNALADELKRAGDKAGAARVKSIKRASPVAWALNQVHFSEPELLLRAREVADELRGLQTQRGGDPRELADALERQRVSMDAVVSAALSAWREAGLSDAGPAQRKLFTTLQAWLAGKGEEPPGRMTQELEASGFDAFAGMPLVPPSPIAATPATPRAAAQAPTPALVVQPAPDRAALARAAAQAKVRECEQLAAAARERVELRSGEQAAARRTRDEAEASARDAERRLAEQRALLVQREQALQRSSAALDEAKRVQAAADQALAAARAELSKS